MRKAYIRSNKINKEQLWQQDQRIPRQQMTSPSALSRLGMHTSLQWLLPDLQCDQIYVLMLVFEFLFHVIWQTLNVSESFNMQSRMLWSLRQKWQHLEDHLLSCTRPYMNLSPHQYSRGLDLILVLRLTPPFQVVPAPTDAEIHHDQCARARFVGYNIQQRGIWS